MTRPQLEHIIRAASAITGETDFVIIGSQAILASYPDAPDPLLASREADIYPLHRPEAADLVEGSIGELSAFDETFGYYAHGVGPETAVLPEGWQDRLVILQNENTGQGRGLCLDPHDLAASKLVAGRDKDLAFVGTMLEHHLVDLATLQTHLAKLPPDDPRSSMASDRLNRLLNC